MQLKKTADLSARDRPRIEDVDCYQDAELRTLLHPAVLLAHMDMTIQRLRSKQWCLVASHAARHPAGPACVIRHRSVDVR